MDFDALNNHLNSQITNVLSEIVPGGRLNGKEYLAGSERGGPGDSFRYNVDKRTGADFATGTTFSDLIDLYSKINHISQIEAAKQLAEKFGYRPPADLVPNFRHYKHGDPVATWCYRDETGVPVMYVARYETADGKQFAPFHRNGNGWVMKRPDGKLPLFNLDLIVKHRDRPVLICEGEKAASRAQELVGDRYVVTTWHGGSQAVNRSSWGVLVNRTCHIWPDADRPGVTAGAKIAEILEKTNKSVKIVDITGLPAAYDAADFDGGWPELREFLIKRLKSPESVDPAETPVEIKPVEAPVNVSISIEDGPKINSNVKEAWHELDIDVNERSGQAICNADNVLRVLQGHINFRDNLWYDEFMDQIYWNGKEWTDVDDINLSIMLQRHLKFSQITDGIVHKAVVSHSRRNIKNAPRDYLDALVWDGMQRLETFFVDICGDADTDYTRAVSRNFLISLVARVYRPGCKVDTMPILEGPQGHRKSMLLETLATTQWHSNASSSVHSVDFFQCLKGKWIVEFAELHQFSKTEITKVKDILSTKIDTYRASYARCPENHPRRSVFAGTTNESVYLMDNTGGRRFWPIICKQIDIDRLIRDRDQYFAEAVSLFKSNATWWEVPSSASDVQEDRRMNDPWEDDIASYVQFRNEVFTRDIMSDCLKIEPSRKSRFDEIRIGHVLRRLGFDRKRIRDRGQLRWCYVRQSNNDSQENVSETQNAMGTLNFDE